jgi:serine protease Do
MKRWSKYLIAGVAVAVLASGFVIQGLQGQLPQGGPATPRELTSYRDLVKRVLPAVVSLDANAKGQPAPQREQQGETPKPGFGSGVLIDPSGIILTSNHVVEGADSVTVTLTDGRVFSSRSIRGDKRSDLALVFLDVKASGPLPHLLLGDSDAMEIGDRVLAVGAPFGLSGSVTHGIVSGKGRSLNLNKYEDFLQTDAAINPGNSGGPLISLDGKVVGINAAIKSKNGGFQGVGLAVASNLCKSVVQALRTEGVVRRGYLGLYGRDLTPQLAGQLGLGKVTGVLVNQVYANTPASKAGIQVGDVITAVNGKGIADTQSMQNLVVSLPLKKQVPITVVRSAKVLTLQVTIEEQPEDFGVRRQDPPQAPQTEARAEWGSQAGASDW